MCDDELWADPAINHSCQTKEKAVYKFLQGEYFLHYLNFPPLFYVVLLPSEFPSGILFERNLTHQICYNF